MRASSRPPRLWKNTDRTLTISTPLSVLTTGSTSAFPWDTAPRFLLGDRDAIYGSPVRRTVQAMGLDEVLTAPGAPWQKDYASYCTSSV
jgi:hypothetical protein